MHLAPTIDKALEYLAKGWSVIPCEPRGKIPLIKWQEFTERLPTTDEVRTWYARWPNANLAVVTGKISGLVVVDIDTHRGGEVNPKERTGCYAETGGGGYHLFYKYPPNLDERINNKVGKDGTDIRADGGYVIVAPSVHASGKAYTFTDGVLTFAPEWTYKKGVKKQETASTDRSGKWIKDLLERGPVTGSRNDDAASLAGYFAKQRIPTDIAIALLRDWNNKGTDPLNDDELSTTIKSSYRTARQRDTQTQNANRKKFQASTLREYMLRHGAEQIEWSVEGWLPEQTIAFMVAPPESFKTWIELDLAVSIASGKPFLGKYPVKKPGPVLVIQQEDFHGQTAERLATIMATRLNLQRDNPKGKKFNFQWVYDLPIHLHEDRLLQFSDVAVMDELEELIKELNPILCILDPLYSATSSDDYMARDVKHMLRMKQWRDTYGTSFLFAHHTRKAMQAKTVRTDLWGSQFLNAFLETGFNIRRPNEDVNTITVMRHFKSAARPEHLQMKFDIKTNSHYRIDIEKYEPDEASEPGRTKTSEVLNAIEEFEPITLSGLVDVLEKNESTIKKHLSKLKNQDKITNTNAGYVYKRITIPGS